MKRIRKQLLQFSAASLALVATLTCRADYPAEVLSLKPINSWRLNEAGPIPPEILATNIGALGAAGNGNYVNGTRGVPGALAGETTTAASFPGDNSRVTVAYDAPTMGSSTFTIEAWVRPAISPPPSGQSSLAAVLSCGKLSDPRTGWLIYQAAAGWNLRGYNGADSAAAINITGGPTPTAGTWYHIAATFDGTVARVYVDGVEATVSGTITTYAPNTEGVLSIGTRSDVAFPYSGDVDEVAYYTSALSAATIGAHYAAGTSVSPATPYAAVVGASSPSVYLRLNEAPYAAVAAVNTGTRGSAANGAYNPGVAISTGIRPPTFPGFEAVNTAPAFDGTSGSINCGTDASLSGPTDFTVMAWVKTTSAANGVIIQQRDVDGAVPGYNGEYKLSVNADGSVQFMLYKDDYQFDFATTSTVNDGNWHQVVAVRKGLDGLTYIDGVLAGSNTGTEVRELVGGIRTFIGRDMRDFIDTFNGEIDEVAMFDKALGAGTVLSLYDTAIGSNAAPVMVSNPPVMDPPTTIYATTTFTIMADVAGALPMTYQWRKDGVVVGTSRDYTKANASVSDNGNYDVIITNPYGSVTSAAVTVSVNAAQPAQIVLQPSSRSVYPGGTASFSVEATGTPPLTYQWKKAGANMIGETNQTLIISNASAADVAAYSVGVTNVAGGTVSQGGSLTIRTPAAASYEDAVVNSTPIGYWRLGESTGLTAFDYAGGNDGSYTNVTLGQPGYSSTDPNTAAAFDRAQLSVVSVPRLGQFNYAGSSPVFTLEAWANFADFTDNQRLFSKGGPGFHGIGFGVFDTGGTLRFTTYGVQDFNLSLPTPLVPGTWYHIVGVATGGTFNYYLNGEPAGSIAFSGACIAADGNPPFAIGRNGLGVPEAVNGVIDEAAVYNKALTPQEIQAHYSVGHFGSTTPPLISTEPFSQTVAAGTNTKFNAGVQGSLPIAYQWKKDGVNVPGATSATLSLSNPYYTDAGSYVLWATNGVGFTNTTVATLTVMAPPSYANLTNGLVLHLRFDGNYSDTSGHANDAAAVGAPPFAAGKIGQAVHIATTPGNNYLTVPDNAGDLAFDDTNSFTTAFWVKYTSRFNDVPIIGNAINSTYQLGWVFTDDAGKLEWSLVSTANSGTYLRDPVPNCPVIGDGAWHHVVAVVDRTAQLASAYIDGNLASSWSIVGLGSLNPGNTITIGQDPNGSYGSATFDLDDLGMWRLALTDYEATSIYAAAQTSGSSFDVVAPVKVYVNQVGTNFDVSWQAGTLRQSTAIGGPYLPVPGAAAPFYRTTATGSAMFFRVQ
jgi:hypothetical protein